VDDAIPGGRNPVARVPREANGIPGRARANRARGYRDLQALLTAVSLLLRRG
jgi:hypothetical protein